MQRQGTRNAALDSYVSDNLSMTVSVILVAAILAIVAMTSMKPVQLQLLPL